MGVKYEITPSVVMIADCDGADRHPLPPFLILIFIFSIYFELFSLHLFSHIWFSSHFINSEIC